MGFPGDVRLEHLSQKPRLGFADFREPFCYLLDGAVVLYEHMLSQCRAMYFRHVPFVRQGFGDRCPSFLGARVSQNRPEFIRKFAIAGLEHLDGRSSTLLLHHMVEKSTDRVFIATGEECFPGSSESIDMGRCSDATSPVLPIVAHRPARLEFLEMMPHGIRRQSQPDTDLLRRETARGFQLPDDLRSGALEP
jgi:hypothetical protein